MIIHVIHIIIHMTIHIIPAPQADYLRALDGHRDCRPRHGHLPGGGPSGDFDHLVVVIMIVVVCILYALVFSHCHCRVIVIAIVIICEKEDHLVPFLPHDHCRYITAARSLPPSTTFQS